MSFTDLSPVTLVLQEVQTVTSSMRRNQRWASTSATHFASSTAPLPPSLHAAKTGRRSAGSLARSSRSGKGNSENVDDVDLMVGFVELRRSLSGVKGRSDP